MGLRMNRIMVDEVIHKFYGYNDVDDMIETLHDVLEDYPNAQISANTEDFDSGCIEISYERWETDEELARREQIDQQAKEQYLKSKRQQYMSEIETNNRYPDDWDYQRVKDELHKLLANIDEELDGYKTA